MPAVALLVACSGDLNPSNAQTTAGSAGIGRTAAGGATGTGGSGGSVPLPACTTNEPMFGLCIGNDAEGGTSANIIETHTSGAATIEAVGSIVDPVSCRYERAIGLYGPSDWWFQARAADNRLWTIGVQGLGSTPLVSKGEVVTLDVDWRPSPAFGFAASTGQLQLSDAAGTPLLWASAVTNARGNPTAPTWISIVPGDYACGSLDVGCDRTQRDVIATVNGSSMTLPPYGAGSVGGYFLRVTTFTGLCGDYADSFEAAAARQGP